MTQDEVIRMAREAGLMQVHSCCNVPDKLCNLDVWQGNIQAFFALAFAAGSAHEREACAKVCEEGVDTEHPIVKGHIMKNFGISEHLAAAIRERGQA